MFLSPVETTCSNGDGRCKVHSHAPCEKNCLLESIRNSLFKVQ